MRPNVAMAALISGDIDYVELIGSIIRGAAKGLPVRAISTGIKAPFFSFVAQHKYKVMKDLKGTTIGMTSIGGTNHVSTRLTLRQFGPIPKKMSSFWPSAMKNSCTKLSRSVASTRSSSRRRFRCS
jgi:ABC-type nitrate/sulfonate/bicarbonate transport system substrate-binding protein